jgi:hypothetical protein
MSFKRWSGLVVLLFGLVSGQVSRPVITGVAIEPKRNGCTIRIFSTGSIPIRNVSGWFAETQWFYLTILGAVADTARIPVTPLQDPVTAIQAVNTAETAQLSFKLDKSIDGFELYQSREPAEILLTLRFPVSEVLSALLEEKQELTIAGQASIQTGPSAESFRYQRVKTALYLLGTSLTIAGVIAQDNRVSGVAWELPTGLALIIGTYLYDRYLHPRFVHG